MSTAKRVKRGLVILIAVFVAACTTSTPIATLPVATQTVSVTPLLQLPTATQTSTRMAVATRLRTATSTPLPTFTPVPMITEIRDETPIAMSVYSDTAISPNNAWKAIFTRKYPEGLVEGCHVELQVAQSNSLQEWKLEDKWTDEPWGCTGFEFFQWSQDESYLYYLEQPPSDACFTSTPTLKRANLHTGQVLEISSGDNLTISPDEALIAYTNDLDSPERIQLTIENLETTERRSVEFEASWAEPIIWSPDGSTVALTLINNYCDRWQTSIAIVASQTMTASILLPFDSGLRVVDWIDNRTIHLKDFDDKDWQLDIISRELTSD